METECESRAVTPSSGLGSSAAEEEEEEEEGALSPGVTCPRMRPAGPHAAAALRGLKKYLDNHVRGKVRLPEDPNRDRIAQEATGRLCVPLGDAGPSRTLQQRPRQPPQSLQGSPCPRRFSNVPLASGPALDHGPCVVTDTLHSRRG